jgi:chemotaxis protein CheZ
MYDLGKVLLDKLKELRIKNNGKIEIDDIDVIIRNFMETIKGHIDSTNDIAIFSEIEQISKQIKLTRSEMVNLNPAAIGEKFIPGATSELEAVTKATEQSTNIILDAAETIQNIAMQLPDKVVSGQIIDKITAIFEACNFQDITGQRIAKTLKALEEIDSRISSLVKSIGIKASPQDHVIEMPNQRKTTLTGPQLEAPSQNDIDNLFNSKEAT